MDFGSFLGQLGVVLGFGLATVGSAAGIGLAGKAAAGAWAKDARAGKPLRFHYFIFVGAPITQTFYAMIVMNSLQKVMGVSGQSGGLMLGIGLATGLGELVSAWMQGAIGAAACRALSEAEGKGLALLLIAIGIVETVGIFTFVFMLGMVPK